MADDTTDQTDDQQQDDTTDQTDDQQLGEAGQRALAEERAARRKAEKDAKATKAELERIKTEGQSEQEKAIAKARSEGATEALTKANERVLKAEVRAAAKGKLADPADAALFLDLSQFDVGDDGEVDAKAIDKAIDDLIKRKPHLAGAGTKRTGSADGGARGNGKTPPDMNAWLRGERVSL